MIHELRTYTMRPGTAPEAAKLSGSLGVDIRGDNFGRLEGYWMTEIGPLNQVMHLWSYADLNERTRLRGELAQNERWRAEYLPEMRSRILRQDIRLLNVVVDLKAPESDGNIYEFRNYRLKPGAVGAWLERFAEILPTREKYSKIVGLWNTEAGQPNEVCHLWAYPDLNSRAETRAAVAADPDWQAFLKNGPSVVEEMHSTIILPAAHSKLR